MGLDLPALCRAHETVQVGGQLFCREMVVPHGGMNGPRRPVCPTGGATPPQFGR
jgi:hypothetical protein